MDENIYDTPTEPMQTQLNEILQRLASKVDITWLHHQLPILNDIGAQELNYMCQKLEAFILYLQLEANYERLQNTAQREALMKITQALSEYNRTSEQAKTSSKTIKKRSRFNKWLSKYKK